MVRSGNLEERLVLAVVDVRNPHRAADHEIGLLEKVLDALLRGGLQLEEAAMEQKVVLEEPASLAVQCVGAGLLDYDQGAGGHVAVFGRHGARDYLDFLVAHGDGIERCAAVHGGGDDTIFVRCGLPGLAAVDVKVAQ